MTFDQKKIAQEQIWKYLRLEQYIDAQIKNALGQKHTVAYRIVDSLFLDRPEAWTDFKLVVTDNIPLKPVAGQVFSLYPEYWHVYHYHPDYKNRPASYAYNCFMNRISDDRAQTYHYLVGKNLLSKGLVSFNCLRPGNAEVTQSDRLEYGGPYNNIQDSLEQSIIDSNISIVLETYISDDHITFSEKIFRALQLPRPWLLYCSPGSVGQLRHYGFDVLDDYVDHGYDNIPIHTNRLLCMLDQVDRFIDRCYTDQDHARFAQATRHNQDLLFKLSLAWPDKLEQLFEELKNYD
jgi:hypothetical protein